MKTRSFSRFIGILLLIFLTATCSFATQRTAVLDAGTGILDIPGLEINGSPWHIKLQFGEAGLTLLSAEPGQNAADLGSFFDLNTARVFLPFISFNGSQYWAVLKITSADPIILQVVDAGLSLAGDAAPLSAEEQQCVELFTSFKLTSHPTVNGDELMLLQTSSNPYCQAALSLANFMGPVYLQDNITVIDASHPDNATISPGVTLDIQDQAESLRLAQASAAQGNSYGQYMLGLLNSDDAYALMWFIISAARGNSWAENAAGSYYVNGTGVVKGDETHAQRLFQQAADQDNPLGMGNLATIYQQNGQYDQAFTWLQKATLLGAPNAPCQLAFLYANGLGVTQDYTKAMEWCQSAADQGDPFAQSYVGWIYLMEENYAEAFTWLEKAALQGDADAQSNLGYLYEYGYAVTQDYTKAMEWYQRSYTNMPDFITAYNIGNLYEKGLGVEKDLDTACHWYSLGLQMAPNDQETINAVNRVCK